MHERPWSWFDEIQILTVFMYVLLLHLIVQLSLIYFNRCSLKYPYYAVLHTKTDTNKTVYLVCKLHNCPITYSINKIIYLLYLHIVAYLLNYETSKYYLSGVRCYSNELHMGL